MTDSGFCSSYNQTSHDERQQEESDSEDNKENVTERRNEQGSKKLRTTFTEAQKRALDVYFQRNPYPDPRETEELSQQLSLPENVIKVWFQNKRSRDKQRKFSHKARAALIGDSQSTNFDSQPAYTSSPLVANLQMLTSRFNSYAAAAAVAAQAQSGKLYF